MKPEEPEVERKVCDDALRRFREEERRLEWYRGLGNYVRF